jgi:hypothetical protein
VGGALFADVEEVETAEIGDEAVDPELELGEELGGKGEVVVLVSMATGALVGVEGPEPAEGVVGADDGAPGLEPAVAAGADEGDLAPGLDDDALVPGFA